MRRPAHLMSGFGSGSVVGLHLQVQMCSGYLGVLARVYVRYAVRHGSLLVYCRVSYSCTVTMVWRGVRLAQTRAVDGCKLCDAKQFAIWRALRHTTRHKNIVTQF